MLAFSVYLHEAAHLVVAHRLGVEVVDVWVKPELAETRVVCRPGQELDRLRVRIAGIALQRLDGAQPDHNREDKRMTDWELAESPELAAQWDWRRELDYVYGILVEEQDQLERLSQALFDLGGCMRGSAVSALLERQGWG